MPLFIWSPGCASGPDIVEITPTLISVCAAAMPIPASDAPSSAGIKRDILCMPTPSLNIIADDDGDVCWNHNRIKYKGVSGGGQASWPSDRRERRSNHQIDQLAAADRRRRGPTLRPRARCGLGLARDRN